MDGIIIAAAVIITILGTIGMFFGPWAVVLVIAAVIFGGYKFFKSAEKSENEKYTNSDYVKDAFKFIEFYELQSAKTGRLVITPTWIGIWLSDERLGIQIKSYLESPRISQAYEIATRDLLYEKIGELFAGEKGITLFKKLGLDVKLHKDDEDWPVIFMYRQILDTQNLDKYAQAIKCEYKIKYGSELDALVIDEF